MLGGQEHELNMRTVELIEDNAQQALELLIQYATSSRMSSSPVFNHVYANKVQLPLLGTRNY
jgi:hypothetical protein